MLTRLLQVIPPSVDLKVALSEVEVPVAAYMVSPLTARSTMSIPAGPKTSFFVSIVGMLLSANHISVRADAGAAITIRLVSSAMVKPTPSILVNFFFIDL